MHRQEGHIGKLEAVAIHDGVSTVFQLVVELRLMSAPDGVGVASNRTEMGAESHVETRWREGGYLNGPLIFARQF